MADTFTPAANIRKPANNASGWDTLVNANFDLLDSILSPLVVATTEVPSASLFVKVSAGSFRKSDGTIVDYAGASSQVMTASQSNYLYLSDNGALTVNTTGWPVATYHVRLAVVTTSVTTVTSIAYPRVLTGASGKNNNTVYLPLLGGTFDDSGSVITVGTGTTNGVKFGAGATSKLGFFGVTPGVQPANSVDLAVVLSSLGLRASGGNPSLNIGSGVITCGACNIGGLTTIGDGQNIAVGTTTGTKVGTATSQKLGFWNAAPIVQPASANQAAAAALTIVALVNSTTGTSSTTIGDVGASFDQTTLNNIHSSLLTQINNSRTDLTALRTLLNQLRSDLIAAGLIKGSA